MIIAEATTKSGKLVQVDERKREDRSEYYPLEYFVLVDGQDLHDFPHNRESVALPFFQACQEGCEQ
ncbi:hypothetical protein [Cohaesibacter gelatinilyticus]|uniref:Uncharacterized protein n=1 Tax=Cohaesibacter gelatinilyticus TaxID=372072 RepID=A0A285PIY3_9HYPH|nr:hypothetical protein [Cohaesibacter gelatinilyticus]SNZ21674.1 hypothetical protein SAMN06265368_4799 [Cohaesibacter gelatinilyticus]